MTHIVRLLSRHSADLTWQRAFYEDLHEHPELSGHEHETAEKIARKLVDFDCEVISHIGARPVADLKAMARGEGIAV